MNGIKDIFKPLLIIFSKIYFIIIEIRNQIYDLGIKKINKNKKPIISVGNITTGGTGKTPMVIEIAKILKEFNKKPIIISRGFRRKSKGTVIVSNNFNIFNTPEYVGDEPYLIAKKLKGVPVIVDRNRYRAADVAKKNFDFDIIILDDAFQHRKIFRDLDIVMINYQEKDTNYHLLPLGKLRENIKSLKRADLIIWSKYNHKEIQSNYNKKIKLLKKEQIYSYYNIKNKKIKRGSRIIAFCGIGDPNSFTQILKENEFQLIYSKFYKDHHKLNLRDLNELIRLKNKYNVDYLITTEKDWVKLPEQFKHDNTFSFIEINVEFTNQGKEILKRKIKSLI